MKLLWSEKSWKDYIGWQKEDKRVLKRINLLIENIKRDPYNGIGKPEPLKYELSGYHSRRINEVHRLVYRVENDTIYIVSCKFHYE